MRNDRYEYHQFQCVDAMMPELRAQAEAVKKFKDSLAKQAVLKPARQHSVLSGIYAVLMPFCLVTFAALVVSAL